MRLPRHTAAFGSLLVALVGAAIFFAPGHAAADYVENNLIDDNYFLDAASMSQTDIQNFLQARGGYLATYNAYSGRDSATVPASRIIYEAAQDYGISPKEILATLQKEQSLVTAQNPVQSQLDYAMGYGCPDSSGCGTTYLGFFNQVDNATWQFRFNFERARGNNTWWRSDLTYPCSGTTNYYSTGLYPGRSVTFYDDNGVAYKTFTINNNATASLYCYTPHAYNNPQGVYGNPQFGYTGMYYSGSYNFVKFYELWFGTTQPGVVVTSPLRIEALPQGIYTGTPIKVSFDMQSRLAYPMGIGSMAVAVRDSKGNNYDLSLQPVLLPAYGTVTYSASEVLPAEDTYTFWITNYNGGAWSDTYPTSSSIDNPRNISEFVQALPTISMSPTLTPGELRVGKGNTVSFKVKNNSLQAFDVGKVALAVRSQAGENYDLPLQATGVLAAGAEFTYASVFTPSAGGSYTGFITATKDNGVTWNESTYPGLDSGMSRGISFTVNPSPTLTQGPSLSIASPRVGQQVVTSFKIKNYGDTPVWVGHIGLAIRDPQGQNVDPGAVDLTVDPASEYVFQAPATFTTPGTYTAWVTVTRDGGKTWDDITYPTADSPAVLRKMTFVVQPSPTVTVQPTITTADPRVGKSLSATFTIHNYGDQAVSIGQIALAARDPQGRNVDFAPQAVTIPAGQDYVYVATNAGTTYQTAGTYTAWITVTKNGGKTWDDTTFPSMETSSLQRRISFTVNPSPTLTQGPSLSIASPRVGQQVVTSFKIKNYGDTPVWVGHIGLAIRDPQGQNVDPGAVDLTVDPASEYVFQAPATFTTPGTYTAWVTVTRDGGKTWDDITYPASEDGSVERKVTFTVQP